MKPPCSSLSIWINNGSARIRIEGRANCNASLEFKTLIRTLHDRGHRYFILDLEKCLLMDSTFLGVLAGLGQGFESLPQDAPKIRIELCNVSERICDLLDNLGVTHLFKISTLPPIQLQPANQTTLVPGDTSRLELSRASLQAHQTLMDINPANIPKFKDVTLFLAEDLKRAESEES